MSHSHPALSVVVASFSGPEALARCLNGLGPDTGKLEIIVATASGPEMIACLAERFPEVCFVAAPKGASVFELRSLGLAQARGDLIALTEDHCVLSPEWAEAFIRAGQSGHTLLGGPVENGRPEAIGNWALYFCEFGNFMPPLGDGPARAFSGANAAFRRQALWSCHETWQHAFCENEVHDALRGQGHRPFLVSQAIVHTCLRMPFREAMGHLFAGGRRFGCARRARASPRARWFWALAWPAVPLVLLGRIVRRVACSRLGRLPCLLLAMPQLCCLLAAWTAGEAWAYLSPAGSGSCANRSRCLLLVQPTRLRAVHARTGGAHGR